MAYTPAAIKGDGGRPSSAFSNNAFTILAPMFHLSKGLYGVKIGISKFPSIN